MGISKILHALSERVAQFSKNKRANIAMTFALALIPIALAAGAGLDLSRAMLARARMAEALDAAGLAVGGQSGLSQTDMTALANKYFTANYHLDSSFGTPSAVTVVPTGQTIKLNASVDVPTVLVRVGDFVSNTHNFDKMTVGVKSEIVWGQTKLWVSLALDNTGSMSETDKTGTSKISALKTATHQLLATLKNAATNDGDVQVAIVPFSKTVNVGTAKVGAAWIDWTDWSAAPPSSTPDSTIGPGSTCPYSTQTSPYGYDCVKAPTNGSASSGGAIPVGGTYNGYVCPGVDDGGYYSSKDHSGFNTGRGGHYYNGCYTSVSSSKTKTTTCVTVGNGNASCTSTTANGAYTGTTADSCTSVKKNGVTTKTCIAKTGAPYTHTWTVNAHSTWTGCIMDRPQDYDTLNTTPSGSATNFPAENTTSCVPSVLGALNHDWTSLNSQVDAMSAGGSTNQTIGMSWGWQAQTQGLPLSATALPKDTSQVIILLSDGLNTQDRWYGNGSDQSSSVDTRLKASCDNAKAQGITIYTVFVDLGGTSGSSDVLRYCATDAGKYYDLTTSGAIVTAFNQIAQQITNLRVSN